MATKRSKTYEVDLNTMKHNVTEESSAEVKTNGPQTKNGTVINTACLNVRRSPRGGNNIVGLLDRGDKVQILGENGPYYRISTASIPNGYVLKKYIREE